MNKHEFFRLLIAGELDNVLMEPDEFAFIRMLKEQEKKRNGCRRKNTRNQHRGKEPMMFDTNEKHYNLTLVLISLVGWLVCLVCVALAVCGILWLIGIL